MLKSLITITLLALSSAATAANDQAIGGVGSGGGNGYGSSRDEISSALQKATSFLEFELDRSKYEKDSRLNPQNITDPTVKAVLSAWMPTAENEGAIADLKSSAQILGEDPCQGDANEGQTDASTKFVRNADICFSISRLSRFPDWALLPELFALVGHETAHHFGFDEASAQTIQAYLYRNYRNFEFMNYANMIFDSMASRQQQKLSANYWAWAAKDACLQANHLIGLGDAFGAELQQLEDSRMELMQYCTISNAPENKAKYFAIVVRVRAYTSAYLAVGEPGTSPPPPPQTPPPTGPGTQACTTSQDSQGPGRIAKAELTTKTNGDKSLKLFITKPSARTIVGALTQDSTFGEGLLLLDEKIEKRTGIDASVSLHAGISYVGVKRLGSNEDPDVLECH